jgi:surface antigen
MTRKKVIWLAGLIATFLPAAASSALAFGSAHHGHHHRAAFHTHRRGLPVIQCVAFAKQDAGIMISGNARDWWSNAVGVYQRGVRPETGSVLSFRENGRMPLGHVAVVSAVVDSRTIQIDQAHWDSRGITRDIVVKDVSDDNDWSAVRVQLGRGSAFGSIYPTHGFIYPRPDNGTLVANDVAAPMPELGRAPSDLRGTLRGRHGIVEVAEVPQAAHGLDLTIQSIANDAPYRDFR